MDIYKIKLKELIDRRDSYKKKYGKQYLLKLKEDNIIEWRANRFIGTRISELKTRIYKPEHFKKVNSNREKNRIKRHGQSQIGGGILPHAKKIGVECNLTRTQIKKWFLKQNQVCYYCGFSFDETMEYLKNIGINLPHKRLTIDRVSNNKGYVFENMVLACTICNTAKKDFFSVNDFADIVEKYIKPKILRFNQRG